MNSYRGDLSALTYTPIKEIIMYSFNGDLSPLKNTPIQVIDMRSFRGDLYPLVHTSIQNIYIYKSNFKGNIPDELRNKFCEPKIVTSPVFFTN